MYIVYNANISSRLKFTFNFIFNELLQTEVVFTKDKDFFENSSLIKINYSNNQINGALQFKPSGLLNKKGLEEIAITISEWKGIKTFFKVKNDGFPFDPFSATFYLISRYEEYLPHKRDHYNRFIPSNSLAVKNNFLHQPIVDIWAILIKERIKEFYPKTEFKPRLYSFRSTIDIDNAYAYIEKGFVRTVGALVKSLLDGKKGDFKQRINTFLGRKKDPFDTFNELHIIHQKYKVNCLYFFLLADYGMNDKNVPHTSKKFQALIKGIGDYYQIGIHPSFGSNSEENALKKEIKRLFEISHKVIENSRQHFLKLEFPRTYRRLIEHEILHDFTMGYAGEIGFRASTCSSFYFYDLDREQTTKLRIHPFCVMDASLKHYLNINVEEVIPMVQSLIKEVRNVNGTFTILWHNESLSGIAPWHGWENIYEEVVKIAAE